MEVCRSCGEAIPFDESNWYASCDFCVKRQKLAYDNKEIDSRELMKRAKNGDL